MPEHFDKLSATPKRPLKVFLCHARDDKSKARELYRYLKKRGIQPWLDAENLLPGQNWQTEIPQAIETSDAIIICLSKSSVDKEGYVQKEIKFALDKALEMPEGRIFIIPARLDECDVPRSLGNYQWVDLFEENGHQRLMKSLKHRATQLQRAAVQTLKVDETAPKLPEQLSLKIERTPYTITNAKDNKNYQVAALMVTSHEKKKIVELQALINFEHLYYQPNWTFPSQAGYHLNAPLLWIGEEPAKTEIELRPNIGKIILVCELKEGETDNGENIFIAVMGSNPAMTSATFGKESIFQIKIMFQGKLEGEEIFRTLNYSEILYTKAEEKRMLFLDHAEKNYPDIPKALLERSKEVIKYLDAKNGDVGIDNDSTNSFKLDKQEIRYETPKTQDGESDNEKSIEQKKLLPKIASSKLVPQAQKIKTKPEIIFPISPDRKPDQTSIEQWVFWIRGIVLTLISLAITWGLGLAGLFLQYYLFGSRDYFVDLLGAALMWFIGLALTIWLGRKFIWKRTWLSKEITPSMKFEKPISEKKPLGQWIFWIRGIILTLILLVIFLSLGVGLANWLATGYAVVPVAFLIWLAGSALTLWQGRKFIWKRD